MYGARPLKRAIQHQLENPLAQAILRGDFGPGARVLVTARDGKLGFVPQGAAEPAPAPKRRKGLTRRFRIIARSQDRRDPTMPIYEYQCEKCGHHLEALQKISDKPLRECPECGKHSLKRLMSAPLFRLAGSGWYETDFKSDKEQKRNLVEKGDAEPAGAESKGEAKPAAVPAAKPESKPESKTESMPAPTAASSRRRSKASSPRAQGTSRKSPSRKKAPARARKR